MVKALDALSKAAEVAMQTQLALPAAEVVPPPLNAKSELTVAEADFCDLVRKSDAGSAAETRSPGDSQGPLLSSCQLATSREPATLEWAEDLKGLLAKAQGLATCYSEVSGKYSKYVDFEPHLTGALTSKAFCQASPFIALQALN